MNETKNGRNMKLGKTNEEEKPRKTVSGQIERDK